MSNVTSEEIYREVMNIKKDVQSVKHQTQWMLRSHAAAVAGDWERVFGMAKSKKRRFNLMKVYLAANGKRTVKEVAAVASVFETDAGQDLAELERNQLVELLPQKKTERVYNKTPADFALGISQRLEAELKAKNGKSKG